MPNVDAYRKSRLKRLIEQRCDGSAAAFAAALGISKGRVSQLLDPDEPFKERAASNLYDKARDRGLPWLPSGYFEQGAPTRLPQSAMRMLPVIEASAARNFRRLVEDFPTGPGGRFLTADRELSPQSFALVLTGDSMIPDLAEGDHVIIDPDVQPRNGDFVAALCGPEDAALRKFRQRTPEVFELIPLNDRYESQRSDMVSIEILGTMVEHRRYRREN